MGLVDETLFGPRDRVAMAIARLREFEPPEGYYLAFSGGKDSQTILRLAERAGVRFDAHFSPTTVDPPELVRFIKHRYPQVAFNRPERSMWSAIRTHGWPPTRQMRYCCREFKETGGHGRRILTGIRWAESVRRKRRRMVETCYVDGTRTFVHPIIDWLDDDVWQFLADEHLPHCSLYDEGFHRIGCVLCPMSSDAERDVRRWPDIAIRYIRTFGQVIEDRRAAGKRCSFATGEEIFAWWISRRQGRASVEGQGTLFE